jgi:hypothetical protein
MSSVAHGIFTFLTWVGVVGMVVLIVWILCSPSRSRRATSLEKARQLGRDAADAGQLFHNNPFVYGTEERLEWESARMARMDENFKRSPACRWAT